MVPIWETINAFPSWRLADGILCDVTVASGPPSLQSFFSWESLSGQPKSWVRIPFDMHSFHNLTASFRKGSHECGLDVWPKQRVFLNSDILTLKWQLSLIPERACLKHLYSNFHFPNRKLKLSAKRKHALTSQKRFKKKLWWLVIWWRPGLARCLGCKDWKSTNEGLLSVQD